MKRADITTLAEGEGVIRLRKASVSVGYKAYRANDVASLRIYGSMADLAKAHKSGRCVLWMENGKSLPITVGEPWLDVFGEADCILHDVLADWVH